MLGSEEIHRSHFPNINVLLGDVLAAVGAAIPALVKVVGLEDEVAPAVEDPQLEMIGVLPPEPTPW